MTVKENIMRLLKLHMARDKKNKMAYGIAIFVFMLVQLFVTVKSISDSEAFAVQYFNTMSMAFIMLVGWAVFSGLEGYTILCDDGISMYPGTIKSRFAARLIWDHMGILVVLCISVAAYLIQGLLIMLLSAASDQVIIGNAFDIQYLFWGAFRLLGFALLAYSIFALWFVLLVRFPWVGYIIIGAIVLLGIISMSNMENALAVSKKTSEIFSLYMGKGKYSAYTGVLACIATWAALLLAAWLIGSRAKRWKSQKNAWLYITIAFVYCGSCLFMSGLFMSSMEEISSDNLLSPKMENVVSKSLDVSEIPKEDLWRFRDADAMMGIMLYRGNEKPDPDTANDIDISILSFSKSEAEEMGISVPEGAVDEDHVYMMAWGRNTIYKGKDLFKPFLKQYIESVSLWCEQATDDGETSTVIGFAAGMDPCVCLVNGMYGDIHKFLKDTTYDYEIDDMLESHLVSMVIYSDDLPEIPEKD